MLLLSFFIMESLFLISEEGKKENVCGIMKNYTTRNVWTWKWSDSCDCKEGFCCIQNKNYNIDNNIMEFTCSC